MPMLLRLTDIAASYRGLIALDGVTLTVEPGQAVGVVGPNGAGKSTLAMAVVGLKAIDRGTVEFEGRRSSRRAWRRVRGGMGYVPEGRRVFAEMTVRENLLVASRLRGRSLSRRAGEMLALFSVLAERADQEAGTLSGGEQQMLAIARALMGGPRLLVLDEPTMGLAPIIVERVHRHLKDIRGLGVGLLILEQSLTRVGPVADQVHVLQRGQVIASGSAADPALELAFAASIAGDVTRNGSA